MGANTNFATWDSRHYQGGSSSTTTFSEGNCRVGTTSGGYPVQISNFAFPATGKYYIELNNIVNNNYHCFGIVRQINVEYGNHLLDGTGAYQYQAWNGQKRGNGGSSASYGSSWTSVGDVIGLAFDADNGKIWWAKNGTWQASGDPAAGSNEAFSGLDASETYYFGWSDYYTNNPGTVHINCGQDSSFSNSKTSGSANATDSNGFGDFYYTPPTGFLALGSASVPVSDDIDPGGDDGATENPTKQFNAITYTGNGGTNAITGLGFKPDLVWVKRRNSSGDQRLVDSSRGVGVALRSNVNGADVSEANGVTAFGTDGFTLGSEGGYNASSDTFVAWCWRANGASTSSNGSGSITSTVQANTKAGFSIITYTGNGSNATIGHGLSAKPDFFTIKNRDGGTGMAWATYHSSLGATKYLEIDAADGAYSGSTRFNDTEPTTSTIGIGTISHVNSSGSDYICYAWHSVEGSSHFGTYIGNGNADGPFVYTGFRPRMIFTKWYETGASAERWGVFDTARATYNPTSAHSYGQIQWDVTDGGSTGSTHGVDFLSNGFKLRGNGGLNNANGGQYIYGAWADVPFRYGNTF